MGRRSSLKAPGRGLLESEDLREITGYVKKHRTARSKFDFANIGWTTGKNRQRDREKVAPFIEAGMTWWLEGLYTQRDSPGEMRRRNQAGTTKFNLIRI